MKKVVVFALTVLCSSTTFAQDVFKQISKIKNYDEASTALKANLSSMSAEQKAKCYNALVD